MNADAPAPAVSVGHQDGQHSHAMPTAATRPSASAAQASRRSGPDARATVANRSAASCAATTSPIASHDQQLQCRRTRPIGERRPFGTQLSEFGRKRGVAARERDRRGQTPRGGMPRCIPAGATRIRGADRRRGDRRAGSLIPQWAIASDEFARVGESWCHERFHADIHHHLEHRRRDVHDRRSGRGDRLLHTEARLGTARRRPVRRRGRQPLGRGRPAGLDGPPGAQRSDGRLEAPAAARSESRRRTSARSTSACRRSTVSRPAR